MCIRDRRIAFCKVRSDGMRLEEQHSKKTAHNAAHFQFLPYSIDESQTDLRVKRASGLSGDLVTGGNEQKRFLGIRWV